MHTVFFPKKSSREQSNRFGPPKAARTCWIRGPELFFEKKIVCTGPCTQFYFKKKLPEIEKGCRLCFGALAGSLVERPNFEVRDSRPNGVPNALQGPNTYLNQMSGLCKMQDSKSHVTIAAVT